MPSSSRGVAATCGRGPLAAAVRAAVAAEVAEVDGVVVVRRGRSCGSASSRRRAGAPAAPGSRPRRRSRRPARGSRPEVGHQRVVGVQHEARARRRARRRELGPAVGQQLELAVAVELVAEEVGQQHERGLELASATPGSHASSTSNRPSWPGSPAGVEQRGGHSPGMFEPARLCTSGRPARSSMAASIAAWSSCRWWPTRAPSRRSSRRAHARRWRRVPAAAAPGRAAVVPPLRPSAAARGPQRRRAMACARRRASGRRRGPRPAGSAAPRVIVAGSVGDRVAVGVDVERPVRARPPPPRRGSTCASAGCRGACP